MESLKEFKEIAENAFRWTSFDPEKRGAQAINEHENLLNQDLATMPEWAKERYIAKFKELFATWIRSRSNCASTMITGASGFNVRRAEKANNREHAKYEEFSEWRGKALKAIAKRAEDEKPEEQKQAEAWEALKKSILRNAETIHLINISKQSGWNKALFVSSLYQKVETFARNGDVETIKKAVDFIRDFNAKKSIVITERHKFFKLVEMAEAVKAKEEANQERENDIFTFEGGTLVQNWSAERFQLIFDEKPAPDKIETLKKNGFKWSPRYGAWQRQNTRNAEYTLKQIFKQWEIVVPKNTIIYQ